MSLGCGIKIEGVHISAHPPLGRVPSFEACGRVLTSNHTPNSATNGTDTVFKLSAGGSVQHIRQVRLKRGLICLNVGRHGLLCHCRHLSLLFVSRHVLVFRDTSLGDAHGAPRVLASAHCRSVAVNGLCAHGALLGEIEAVIHEPTESIHELLLTCRLRGNSWSETPNTSHTPPGSSPASPFP